MKRQSKETLIDLPRLKILLWMIVDTTIIFLTYISFIYLSFSLRLPYNVEHLITLILSALAFQLIVFYVFGLYRIIIHYISIEDVLKITILVGLTNLTLLIVWLIIGVLPLAVTVFVIMGLFQWLLILSSRTLLRVSKIMKTLYLTPQHAQRKTLIIGAGAGGEMVIKELKKSYTIYQKPVLILDDDVTTHHRTLLGVKVMGGTDELEEMIEEYAIDDVIIAIANLPYQTLQRWLNILTNKNVKIRRLPLLNEANRDELFNLKDVRVEDLLNRDPVELDSSSLKTFIHNKTVLVSGGGGSIGSELCRQIASYQPKTLIIFDLYENTTYDIQCELNRLYPTLEVIVLIGSVYNALRLEHVFKTYTPELVYHAAAYKHVPLMEDSAVEAIRTNVLGTYYMSKFAHAYQVKHFVLVSSDKAVRPTNVMGATKRMAELIIKQRQETSETPFSAVRFGNVLNSNGSVIPLFKKQLESGGPLTVTHPEITRFFMTIPEAVSLILQTGVFANGGDIFVLDMGEPVKIRDLAEKMIRLSGLRPHEDIKIKYIGLRPGEKLYEELLIDDHEHIIKTAHEKIFIEQNHEAEKLSNDQWFETLRHLDAWDNQEAKTWLLAHLESFQPKEES